MLTRSNVKGSELSERVLGYRKGFLVIEKGSELSGFRRISTQLLIPVDAQIQGQLETCTSATKVGILTGLY